MTRPVKILYFAWVRERTGTGEEDLKLPIEVNDVGGLITWLQARSPGHAAAFGTQAQVRVAVNQAFARPTTPISPGDEVAFFPPVTGG